MEVLYSCEQVAERYGVKVTTVWDWIRAQKLPAVKIGKQYRVTAEQLSAFERNGATIQSSTATLGEHSKSVREKA